MSKSKLPAPDLLIQISLRMAHNGHMRMVDIIEAKRDGLALTREQIAFFVRGITEGSVPDYQASALLMAILFRGMDSEETSYLTDCMLHSGDTIDLSQIRGIKCDKHSTGGVGDKTSLVLGPLVVASGGVLAKMSGRGLGHTGGTLDKMESVPGTRIALSTEEFIHQVNDIGIAIIGQTKSIDPADKKLYALRDVTGTVESIPLIASSVMSKKLASGSDAILLDVKYGAGAFMKTFESARDLAKEMVAIGDRLGRDTRAIISGMEEPLGFAVGNILEVKEAVETLKGRGPKDLVELVTRAGGIMLLQAKIVSSEEEGEQRIKKAIDDGSGYQKLLAMFKAQGGDVSYLEDLSKFPLAPYIEEIKAEESGYVGHIDSLGIGLSAMRLGAGRATLEDVIDPTAGIVLAKKVGDKVEKGEVLATAHSSKPIEEKENILHAFKILKEKPDELPLIRDYIK